MDKTKRKAVIAGNWKMNKTPAETAALIGQLAPLVQNASCDIVICPSFVALPAAAKQTKGSNIFVGAQNIHFQANGAYTGEVAAGMLAELGVQYAIVGHSERRQYFGETDETVNKRAHAAVAAGITAIICVGETLEQREQGVTEEVVRSQTKIALGGFSQGQLAKVIMAYEPVWAIGTGRTATANQAEEVCKAIRAVIAQLYSADIADGITIQYGGSMNAENAEELLSKPNVDGGLIGGASLKPEDFSQIIKAASV